MLKEKLMEARKEAMKSTDENRKERLSIIKTALAEIQGQEIKKRMQDTGLSEEDNLAAIVKTNNNLKEELESNIKAERHEEVKKLTYQMSVLSEYLPKAMTTEEATDFIKKVIQEKGATTKSDMKLVMPIISTELKGRFDGKEASKIVQSLLK